MPGLLPRHFQPENTWALEGPQVILYAASVEKHCAVPSADGSVSQSTAPIYQGVHGNCLWILPAICLKCAILFMGVRHLRYPTIPFFDMKIVFFQTSIYSKQCKYVFTTELNGTTKVQEV